MANIDKKKSNIEKMKIMMARKMALIFTSFLVVFFYDFSARATEPTFGPEFTLTRDDVFDSFPMDRLEFQTKESVKALEELVSGIKQKFALKTGQELIHKKILQHRGLVLRIHHRLIFPDASYIELLPDPSVIEITASPGTLEEFRKRSENIQSYLFDVAAELNLTAWNYAGGGHIHIGNVFRENPRLLRNFIVDYFNHPFLGDGVLGQDHYNALSFSQMSESQLMAFHQVIKDFDSGLIKTSHELSKAIIDRVYTSKEIDSYWAGKERAWYQKKRPLRNHAMNLKHLVEGFFLSGFGTVEIRALFPQKSMHQFLLLIELFKRRIDILKELKMDLRVASVSSMSAYKNVNTENIEESLRQFSNFVKETGMNPEDFQELIHPQRRAEGLKVPPFLKFCKEILF